MKKIFIVGAALTYCSLSFAHLISITNPTPFAGTVETGSQSVADFTVQNISSIPLNGISVAGNLGAYDMSVLSTTPSSCSSISSSNLLQPNASCNVEVELNAPAVATTISGAKLEIKALPSIDGVVFSIPDITVSTDTAISIIWTWLSGANTVSERGNYGTKGVTAATNVPGARSQPYTLQDGDGNYWLFGGRGFDASSEGELNDLWKYDGTNWTWVSGSNTINQLGNYGTRGTAASTNVPGARSGGGHWLLGTGSTLWLFGGNGYAETASQGYLSDLWKFDGTNWTWVKGPNYIDEFSNYGVKGVASISNFPGGRISMGTAADGKGNLWLFGGFGLGGNGTRRRLGDLWKYSIANNEWTWVSGDKFFTETEYGTQGVPASTNQPGSRQSLPMWADQQGNLWLFGGISERGFQGDLWEFNGTNWIWVSGSNLINQAGIYGTKGEAASANQPGARDNSTVWVDSSGNFWMFGGFGYDANGTLGYLGDLWEYDGTNWIWQSGSDVVNQTPIYGSKGVSSAANLPGSRLSIANWLFSPGDKFLFFGTVGYDSAAVEGKLNDIWQFSV